MTPSLFLLLEQARRVREEFFSERQDAAFRLFNGFLEGDSSLVVDLYARTLVFHDYGEAPNPERIAQVLQFYRDRFPWIHSAVLKTRNSATAEGRRGTHFWGEPPDRRIHEHGVRYAIDLTMNRDASFYLDTRELRAWAKQSLERKTVLNTFAYTGSLGVAALAGGAARVVQLDLNRKFLNLAKESYSLNGFRVQKEDFIVGDFWSKISYLKARDQRFDCVFIDPPFFSTTEKGKVDLNFESTRLINKVRPLVNDGGRIVAINNALFVSGKDYQASVERLCQDGYLRISEIIPVSRDFIGGTEGISSQVTDPAPFNHSTKILVLAVKRKSG